MSTADWGVLSKQFVAKYIHAFAVDDCYRELVTAVKEAAFRVQGHPHNVWVAFVRDADGHLDVKMQCTINGDTYDYAAYIYPHMDKQRPLQ